MPKKLFLLIFISVLTHAEGQWAGFAAFENRLFLEAPQFAGQDDNNGPTLILEPEYYFVSEDRRHTYTARLFFHLDPYDDERTHADIRQLDWVMATSDWELRAGISKAFWGVIESRHLVDIINQTDLVEDVDEEDKLGQPLLQYAMFRDWGTVRFFYLPYFRERTFPGRQGRLRPAIDIADGKATYEGNAGLWSPSFALRYEHTFGAWDLGLAHFHGVSREPNVRLRNGRFVPVYDMIEQTSIDLQYTMDAWLWKLEAIGRAGHGDYFTAVAAGFEYTLYGVLDTDTDVGWIFEYHRDNRGPGAPETAFDHDVFLGTRIALNDFQDTQLLAGVVIDTRYSSEAYFMEFSRRLSAHFLLEADLRIFSNGSDEAGSFVANDDFVQVRVSYFF